MLAARLHKHTYIDTHALDLENTRQSGEIIRNERFLNHNYSAGWLMTIHTRQPETGDQAQAKGLCFCII